jgi:enamine deaminase RidA (YjgF/YER057c/UK114 family)
MQISKRRLIKNIAITSSFLLAACKTSILNFKGHKLNLDSIKIPKATIPIANYASFVKSGNKIFISGQLPFIDNQLQYTGKVGSQITAAQAKEAARICGLNIISQLKLACEDNLDKVTRCIKLGVFINADSNFTDHPSVANGASDLMVEIFGPHGKHSRFAVGCQSLPKNSSIEVEAIFEVES